MWDHTPGSLLTVRTFKSSQESLLARIGNPQARVTGNKWLYSMSLSFLGFKADLYYSCRNTTPSVGSGAVKCGRSDQREAADQGLRDRGVCVCGLLLPPAETSLPPAALLCQALG